MRFEPDVLQTIAIKGKKSKPEKFKVSGRSLYILCLKVAKESKRKAAAKAVSNKETPARKKAKSADPCYWHNPLPKLRLI